VAPQSGRSAFLPLHNIHNGLFWASAVSAGVNECLKLGSGKGCANVRIWVLRPPAVGQGYSIIDAGVTNWGVAEMVSHSG